MKIEVIKAFRSFMRAGGFFLVSFLVCTTVIGAEVSRSISLEDRVRLLEQQLSSANRMRAESQFEVNGLKKEIRMLHGLVEEQGYQLQQIINRQREFYREVENRMNQASDNVSGTTSQTHSANSDSAINNPVNGQTNDQMVATGNENQSSGNNTVITRQPSTTAFIDDSQVRATYDKIFPLVRSKRYDEAIIGYQQFIARYPESIFVANSRYWLAQIYSVQGRSAEAELEYLSVVQQYDKSVKAPDAWLKLGQLYERQGQKEKALDAYNQVVTRYAKSTAAEMAVGLLQSLKE